MSQTPSVPDEMISETPLVTQLIADKSASLELKLHRGAWTPIQFSAVDAELHSLLSFAGVFDLGYRTFLRAEGRDRVRWLNGMITNAVKTMSPGQVEYTLILSPQGRIQGDGDLSCYEDFLLLETDRSQSERLLAHLRRFIIMDQVKLEELDASTTALGIAGPRAAEILLSLGGSVPEPETFRAGQLTGIGVTIFSQYGPRMPRFEIHVPADQVLMLWEALIGAGAAPCGIRAVEKLRVLEGVPAFDVDFSDKHLPQEANLQRALSFTKGCYIGQEIVERIRSRATVHRSLLQFELQGSVPQIGPDERVELRSGESVAGELTSVARIEVPGLDKALALGIVRVEALQRAEAGEEPLRYDGGTAAALAGPPALPRI